MYRKVTTDFWQDNKVERLSSFARYLLLYFLTSPKTNLAGCYEVSYKRIASETGLTTTQIKKALDELCGETVVSYCESTSEVLVRNWCRYNWTKSPKLAKSLKQSIEAIKNDDFRHYVEAQFNENIIPGEYSIDTVSEKNDTVYIPSVSVSVSDTASKGVGVQGEGKHAYGETGNVLLTDSELEKLKAKFPDDWKERIDNLGYYIGSTGKSYKSHYLTILNWDRKNNEQAKTRRGVKADAKYAKFR